MYPTDERLLTYDVPTSLETGLHDSVVRSGRRGDDDGIHLLAEGIEAYSSGFELPSREGGGP